MSVPTSTPALSLAVHPAADKLEIGVIENPFDRGPADATCRPLDHAVRHS